MMQDVARSKARLSLPLAVLIIALGCDRSPTAPLPVPTGNTTPTPPPPPTPAPGPGLMTYRVSGIVTDETDSPIANALVHLFYDKPSVETSTDARGYYSFVFESASRTYDGNPDVVGAIWYEGGGEYAHYVQAVPWGTANVVKNLRPRRVRTLNAGESIVTAIEADSSLAYDGDSNLQMDQVWERFRVRIADAGTLTISARSASGGIFPSIWAECVYVADNCGGSVWLAAPPGTTARRVQANSVLEIVLAIPSRMAPQRYEVATSLK